MIFIKNLFGVRHVPDVSRQAVICSEFVAKAFIEGSEGKMDLCPTIPSWTVTPGDIAKSEKIYLIKGWED
jgi:hypothetical protein